MARRLVESLWRLLLVSAAVWIPGSLSRGIDAMHYETAYACEGKTLKIECGQGERIHLIRANYGRFSITICNDHGNTDWSVNCMSLKSLRVLHSKCTNNQNCSILASTNMFEDPCPGTLKYLEAHYRCMRTSSTTTTNRPSPPWLMTSQPPSVWSTARVIARPSAVTEDPSVQGAATVTGVSQSKSVEILSAVATPSTARPPPLPIAPLQPGPDERSQGPHPVESEHTTAAHALVTFKTTSVPQMEVSPVEYTPEVDIETDWNESNGRDTRIVPNLNEAEACGPMGARGLHWNWTRVGERAIQPCPGGAAGLAHWRCAPGPHWTPETPDLSQCRSAWVTSLEARIMEGDSLIAITSDLAQVTSSKTLYGGDMIITTKIIMKMARKMANNIQSIPDARQREAIVTELLNNVVKTGSNLLDSTQHPSWKDLGYKEQMSVATSLLTGLEENAFLLADTVIREKTVIQTVKNIMLSVRVLETRNMGAEERFPGEGSEGWSASNDWVLLPQSALRENSEGGLVRLVFVAFDRLEQLLQWSPESLDTPSNVTKVLNSKVISASLGKGRHIQLSEPIRLSLRHLHTENVSNPKCVFWDYTMNAWSEEGCHVESTNRTHTMCLCDHLTNFAILMDVHQTQLSSGHETTLQIITYIGCIVSIICLILAIITFQVFRGLKSDRTTIHKNLCICLLIAEVLFIAGINQTEQIIMCGVIAGLLHFFFLCAFAWMFLEGFQLYVMLVEVFEAEKSRARWYYLAGYGCPLLIVAIAATVDHTSYGTDRYCWLRADNYFIFTFIGPVVVVIVANLMFLSLAIIIMCRHANASISMKSKEHSRLASASGKEENVLRYKLQSHLVWLRGAIVLVFLLGLTWTFGLLYLNEETVVMAYIFSILNSLQGFFIFVFHCARNEKVRKEWRKLVRQHSWLPRCLRCSKSNTGTATATSGGAGGGTSGSNASVAANTGKDRRESLYAGNGTTDVVAQHTASQQLQYSLQKGWSSRSCNTIGHISGGKNCPLSTPQTTAPVPLPTQSHVHQLSADNTATMPYLRPHNHHHVHYPESPPPSAHIPAFPKSATTWGPLNKPLQWKNISFKSYSRDSGHGGSEQEDPYGGCGGVVGAGIVGRLGAGPGTAGRRPRRQPGPGPWTHTYTEIGDTRPDDPVYEEIDRQISDTSDMSRQSSRSYSDHRPLIPLRRHGGGDAARSLAAVLDGETVVCHLEPPPSHTES